MMDPMPHFAAQGGLANWLNAMLCEAIRQLGGMMVVNAAELPQQGGITLEDGERTGLVVLRVATPEEAEALIQRSEQGGLNG